MISSEAIKALVAEQLDLIEMPERRAALEALLVEPRLEEGEWEYGELDERYPIWVVAEAPGKRILLVWCDQGFGPSFPWGFLDKRDSGLTSLGMDAQWCWYLEEAFMRAALWPGEEFEDEKWHLPPEERFSQP